jgi:hypothetical protein
MRGLAFRRHQWQRARGRAIRYLRWLWASDPQWVTARAVVRRALDRTPCSCRMCGNPRRFTGAVTRQESQAACRCEPPDAEPGAAADGGACRLSVRCSSPRPPGR